MRIQNLTLKFKIFDTQKGRILLTFCFWHNYACAYTNTYLHFWLACQYLTHSNKFFECVWPFCADLVTFTEEILNGKLHFLCSAHRTIAWIKFQLPLLLFFVVSRIRYLDNCMTMHSYFKYYFKCWWWLRKMREFRGSEVNRQMLLKTSKIFCRLLVCHTA